MHLCLLILIHSVCKFTFFSFLPSNSSAPSAPPEAVTVTALSPYSLSISWQAPPPDSQNGEIRYYTIKMLEEETDTQTWLSTSNSSTNITVESLHPYYSYRVSVAAFSVGLGPYSLQTSVQMPEAGETQYIVCIILSNRVYY